MIVGWGGERVCTAGGQQQGAYLLQCREKSYVLSAFADFPWILRDPVLDGLDGFFLQRHRPSCDEEHGCAVCATHCDESLFVLRKSESSARKRKRCCMFLFI